MKTDAPTALGVIMNEKKPGGNYTATIWSTGNTWQQVELTPADFHLGEAPNDPPDPDGKLDLDQVQGIGLLDLSQILGAAKINLPLAVDTHAGKHTLFLDDFELLTAASKRDSDAGVIDDFTTPQLRWITMGGAELQPEGAGIRIRYQQEEERYVVLIRQLPKIDLRGKTRLAFDIASDRPAQLLLAFEEHSPGKPQGPRYNVTVDVLGGGKVDHRAAVLDAFEAAADGPQDPNGKLDLDNLKTFSILDITAATSHEIQKNSLWVGNVRGVVQ
jgi:hypothetical protein